jgi:hypothetical protein
MMDIQNPLFQRRRREAIRRLEASGIWRANSLPPALRLYWKLGIPARPPHFVHFGRIAWMDGLGFAVFFTLFEWLFQWRGKPGGVLMSVTAGLLAGLLFGLTMAAFYAHGRRKHQLPRWEELDVDARDA